MNGWQHAWAIVLLGLGGCGGDDSSGETRDGGASACETAADCDDGLYCNGAETCMPGGTGADARGCVAAEEPPCSGECDEDADSCGGTCGVMGDADGDGVDSEACGGADCDDADPLRYPGNTEICDSEGRDEDCDPRTFGVRDADGDSSPDALCCNGDICGDDCDDTRAGVNPRATEACDLLDNDCDGSVDEGVVRTYYEDADGDDFGSSASDAMTMTGCAAPPGYSELATDCDDDDGGVNPGVPENCATAGVDDNCNGTADEGCACTPPATRPCGLPGRCAAGLETCVGGAWSACSIAPIPEVCDFEDNDCDGLTDEGLGTTCWDDPDGDGYAVASASSRAACGVCGITETARAPMGAANIDCREGDPTVDPAAPNTHPGAPELCDGIDNDCSSGGGVETAEDRDGDGHTSPTYGGCTGGSLPRDDCNDALSNVYPGQTTFFTTGYCRMGTLSCSICPANPRRCYTQCDPMGSVDCDRYVAPSFDYNCDSVDEPQPPSSGCSGGGCTMACGGGNRPFTAQPSSACGTGVTFRTCGGCPCVTGSTTRTLGCR
jgi:hypothetical protein